MPSRLHARAVHPLPPTPFFAALRQRTANIWHDRPRSLLQLLSENLLAALLVLTVAILSDRVPEPWHSVANLAVAFALVAYSVRLTFTQNRQQRELRVREKAENSLREARDQLTDSLRDARLRAAELNQLTELGQLLQSCITESEAYLLISAALARLLPECSGALYAMSPANHRAELIREWGNTPPIEKIFEPTECWAVRRGHTHNGNRSSSPIQCSHLKPGECPNAVCIPFTAQGEIFGILVLLRNQAKLRLVGDVPPNALAKTRRMGAAVAEQMALTLANLRLRNALRDQAIRDPLTGLFNRRYLQETLERELQRAARKDRPVAVMMLDLDHFKRCNDEFGHETGDAVLRAVGEFLRNRTEDIACRYGGEEFVVILPEASQEHAFQRAQQIREGIKRLEITLEPRLNPVTVSIGLACSSSNLFDSTHLLEAADAALYQAKRDGRDRVAIHQPSAKPDAHAAPLPSQPSRT
jgi:diguanylate cyclase (GGDEF)-like protein